MDNETLNILMNRRSVRAYAEKPICDDDKEKIIDAVMRAPTAGNMMLYSIIEVSDDALKQRLSETCDNQPFIASAPYVLLFAADYQRWFDLFAHHHAEDLSISLGSGTRHLQEGDLFLSICDTLIAAQTAVIAAESMGIGSCYIGDILEHYELHQEIFCLPKYVLPISLVCFGYPKIENLLRQIPRFGKEFIVHQNTYRRLSGDELEEMIIPLVLRNQGRYYSNAQNLGQSVYLRKFISDFSVEMSRSVKEMIASWCSN